MNITSLAYVGVESPESKAWETFGPEVLGLQLADQGEDGTQYLKVDDRHHRLAVHPGARDRLAYLGWEVPAETDLDAAVESLRRSGVDVSELGDEELEGRRVRRAVCFSDPGGIRHELAWASVVHPGSFHPPRRLGGFVTGEQGLGHAVLLVPEMAPAIAFYESVMGFRLSDVVDFELHGTPLSMRFLHCNPRHHSLAFTALPGSPIRGMHHVMLQLRDLDDVGMAYDICRSRDVPITQTLGRHSNDRMVSFYLRTPSGFDVEYGWGAIEVDDTTWTNSSLSGPSIWGHDRSGMLPPGCVEPV